MWRGLPRLSRRKGYPEDSARVLTLQGLIRKNFGITLIFKMILIFMLPPFSMKKCLDSTERIFKEGLPEHPKSGVGSAVSL